MTDLRPTADAAPPARTTHPSAPTDVERAGATSAPVAGSGQRPIALPLIQTVATAVAAAVVDRLVGVIQAVTHAGPGLTIPVFWGLLLVALVGVGTLTRVGSPLTLRPLPRVVWAVLVVAVGWTASLASHVALLRYADGALSGGVVELWLWGLSFGVVAAVLSAHRALLLWALTVIVAASVAVALLGPGEAPAPAGARATVTSSSR
ncbi:hypothetical protein ACWFNE_01175 [Cellulomonas sp. NPDC055163]